VRTYTLKDGSVWHGVQNSTNDHYNMFKASPFRFLYGFAEIAPVLDRAIVMTAWPALPQAIRAGIVATVKALSLER
jgi:hypothetical protein